MSAGGSSANVHLGPGRLYYAPLGTAEPASGSATLDAAFKVVGYTEDGTTVETTITTEGIEVAEEIDPILYSQTKRETKVTVNMAEMAISRLALALGAGAARADNGGYFEFPDPSAIVPVILVWDSAESPTSVLNRRWIFRSVYPSGTISLSRKKAPNKATISATFMAALPTGVSSPVRIFPDASGRI